MTRRTLGRWLLRGLVAVVLVYFGVGLDGGGAVGPATLNRNRRSTNAVDPLHGHTRGPEKTIKNMRNIS